jgi:beta-1,4-mannosyltransferase
MIDIIHLNWPEQFYRLRGRPIPGLDLFWVSLFVVMTRLYNVPYVWEIHDLYPHGTNPHNAFPTERWARRLLLQKAKAIFVHGHAAAKLVTEEFGTHQHMIVAPLGDFGYWYPKTMTEQEARDRMGVKEGEFVYLVFGSHRRNRNPAKVIRAFKALDPPNGRLVIAAGSGRGVWGQIKETAGDDPRIILRPGLVPAEELQVYFKASDILVMPGEWYLTSAVVLLALPFGCPAIVPSCGCSAEMIGQAGFVYEQDNLATLVSAMRQALHSDMHILREKALQRAQDLSWENHVDKLLEGYAEIHSSEP